MGAQIMFSTAFLLAASMVVGQSGEDAFKSYTDFAIGGVWTSTVGGVKCDARYKRTLDDRFVQLEMNHSGIPVTIMIGVDPATKECSWWGFDGNGGVVKWIMSRVSENVWASEGKGMGPKGEYVLKSKLTRIDADRKKNEVELFIINGEKQEPRTVIWTRER
jgi:hypothetical protein